MSDVFDTKQSHLCCWSWNNSQRHDSSPSCFSLSGVRRINGSHPQFSNFREDKENIPHEDDDEDGPILYRDDDSMEEEGECEYFDSEHGNQFMIMFSRSVGGKTGKERVSLDETAAKTWETRVD